jgi:gliding motility-associated-like protein
MFLLRCMRNWFLIVFVFIIASASSIAQVAYYEDNFAGGVTGGGYAPDCTTGGSGSFAVHIDPGSTIRKAFLMAGRHGFAPPLTVTLNGAPYTFDMPNQASPTFFSFAYGGPAGTHVIDVTAFINPTVTTYTLNVPVQPGPMDRYNDFYLYIAYDNATLLNVSTAVFLNDQNFFPIVSYALNVTTPFQNTVPIGVMLFNGYMCGSFDADSVILNGTSIGNTYGPDGSSGWCGGPVANFYYQNNSLFGLGDDNPDQAMSGPDVTSNAQALIANSSVSFSMDFFHGNNDNSHWALILAYGACPPMTINTSSDTTVCAGTSVQLNASGGISYQWYPSAGLNNPNISNPVATPASTTTYYVIVSNGICSDTDSVVVTILPSPVADAGADTVICIGNNVQLNASGGTSYSWSPSTGLSNPNISNPIAAPSSTTTYYVIVSSGNCFSTDSVTVIVSPPPTADAGLDVTICEGESVQLSASGSNSYSWSPSIGLSDANIPNPIASPSATTHYVVTVYNGQCYDSDTITVTVVPSPFVDLGPDINIDKNTPVILTANTSATSFAWSPTNNLSCNTCQSITVVPDTTTTYYVTVSDSNGCTGTDSVTIFIGEEFSIYIPNVFTPNGDLINNIFYVYGINIKNLSVHILNRWGEMIFESNDITKGWDGKYKGVPVPEGAYVYLVRFTGKEGGTEMRTGRVCLIR